MSITNLLKLPMKNKTQPSYDKDSLIYRCSQQFLSSSINHFFFPHKSVLTTLHSLKNKIVIHILLHSFFKLKHVIRKLDFDFEIVFLNLDFSLKIIFSAYDFSLENMCEHYPFKIYIRFLANLSLDQRNPIKINYTLLALLIFGSASQY